MKNITKIFAIAIVALGFASTSFAQSTATATSTATIIGPINLAKTVDMNFGNIAVNATVGSVTLTPASTRLFSGGVTLPIITGTVSAASFTVNGEGTSTYAITLPTADLVLTRLTGTETMTVNSFTSTPSGTGTLSGGSQIINVGAKLNVGASQVAGTYVSGTPFDVTVNYN